MSQELEAKLGFRVRGANIEYTDSSGSGARPATETDHAMWKLLQQQVVHIKDLQSKLMKKSAEVDARSVKDSLGTPRDDGGDDSRVERVRKLAGG